MIQLIERDGSLYTNAADICDELMARLYEGEERVILLYCYPAGDVDTIVWPSPDVEQLRSCLYDCRETGFLPPDCSMVLLPDGTEFSIDG